MLALKVSRSVSPQDVLKRHYPQCVPIHEDAFCEVDKKTLSPYKYRLFVLYRYNFQTELVTVVGFNRYELDTIEPTLPQLVFEPHDPPSITTTTTEPSLVIPWKWNYEKLQEMDVSLDALRERVDWICEGKADMPKLANLCSMTKLCPTWSATVFALLLIGQHVEKFYKKQLIYEAEHFTKLFPTFPERVLIENMSYDRLLEMQVDPTVADEQEYFQRYPARQSPPPWWLNVHFSELPTFLVDRKPLYEGGFCHLEPGEVGEWVWRRIVLDARKIKKPPTEQMQIILSYINTKLNIHKHTKPKIKRSISDLPPCMQFKDHFPKDAERVAFLAVGKRCGVPLRDIEDLLTNLNDRYPPSGGIKKPLKARFDVVFHYEKGYAPPKCETIYWCPIEGDSYDVKKKNCHQKWFGERYPEIYPHTQPHKFKGPHSLMEFIEIKRM